MALFLVICFQIYCTLNKGTWKIIIVKFQRHNRLFGTAHRSHVYTEIDTLHLLFPSLFINCNYFKQYKRLGKTFAWLENHRETVDLPNNQTCNQAKH